MRFLLVAILALGISGVAMANTSNVQLEPPHQKIVNPDQHWAIDGREGGEDIGTAVPITSLPFSDTGATCDNIDDYDEVCPYTGSTSPDVVYSFTPTADALVDIDLCYSSYDTKVYVYENMHTPGAPYACNDDFHFDPPCFTYSSKLEQVPMNAGNTYFIVIDGYGGDCGNYDLYIEEFEPCTCAPGAVPEGEPPLVPDYVDEYNGGCNSNPPYPFQWLEGDQNGQLSFCGHSGTYLYFGQSYRDTDWFIVTAGGNTITWTVTPQFSVNMFQLGISGPPGNPDCGSITVDQQATPAACQTATINIPTSVGEIVYLWVGPTVYGGLPEFEYDMTLDGLEPGAVPVEAATWGQIKSVYK